MTNQTKLSLRPPFRRPRRFAVAAFVLALSSFAGSQASAGGADIPIVETTEEVRICDEDAVVIIIAGDNIYREVETPTGGVEWQTIPNHRIGFGLSLGQLMAVLFEIRDATGRTTNGLYVSANSEEYTAVNLHNGHAEYLIGNASWVYEFEYRPLDALKTPTTADIVFEPSPNCPPSKLDGPSDT